MPPADTPKDLETQLKKSEQLVTTQLSALTDPPLINLPSAPDPLAVLGDASNLLKAHTTKFALLLLNKPFSAPATSRELSSMMNCLSAMISAHGLCASRGRILRQQVSSTLRRILVEVLVFVQEVRAANTSGRDALTSTGVLWGACDRLIELETLGEGGLALERAKVYREQLSDAIRELREWGEHKDPVDDFSDQDDRLPADNVEVKVLLTFALDKLKKIDLLFTALIKRRLARLGHVQTSDSLLDTLKALVETVDDLANAFYELDPDDISEQVTNVMTKAREAITLCRLSWVDDKEDEFTRWSDKWLELVS